MPRHDASELATRLGREAEAVCRHYLSSGHRAGRYWLVGDVQNTPGRSMFVRLIGPESGKGAAGKWTDMATKEHGDLLDIIRQSLGLVDFKDVAEEARRFLALPHPEPEKTRTPTGSTSSIASLRLKGAALACLVQSGANPTCGTLRWSAQREAINSAPFGVPPCNSTMSGCLAWI